MEQSNNIYEHFKAQPLDIGNAVIREDSDIREELEILLYIAENYADETGLGLFVPHSAEEIKAFEERNGFRLTDELKHFYLFTNGMYGMPGTTEIDNLEDVEGYYRMGYCDWAEEGDSEKYVCFGNDGGYSYLLTEKETGKLFICYEEDGIVGIDSFKDELLHNISAFYENILDYREDERIEEYLKKKRGTYVIKMLYIFCIKCISYRILYFFEKYH